MSLRLDILDQQVVDAEERPIGRVDDVELAEDGAPRALQVGLSALAPRLGGALGRLSAATAVRLAPGTQPPAPPLPITLVESWNPLIRLERPLHLLPGVAPLERWLGVHLVSRLPGGGDARE
ncbi:hypothetical protein ACIB24_00150 [Spongisporangium articulatum]|uniref:PRC-barrel domain-containing protein n=1 Tax=Spongisporangium articulatum TaxID=3362603 RepID=A0ABW8AGJ9_9ACTN